MTDLFLEELLAYRLPIHLTVDGARVHNLGCADIAARFKTHNLLGRPLFRETADRSILLAGPWLISLGTDPAVSIRGMALAREVGKGIFWLGEPDSEGLFRHLRKLGAARLPEGRILYFRYYNSDVMAAIVPLVNAEQAAKLFGPTLVIGLVGGTGDCRTVEKPDGLPSPAGWPIDFESWQIEALNDRQRDLSRKNIETMLRSEFPTGIGLCSEEQALQRVMIHEASAKRVGLVSEAGIANWSYLCEYTSSKVENNYSLISYLRRQNVSVDEALDANMSNIIVEYDVNRFGLDQKA